MENQKEIWKTVVIDGVEHPRYQVSNLGRVKNINWYDTGRERILKLGLTPDGYYIVHIDCKNYLAHRIVAMSWLENPQNKPYVDHINTVRTDNRVVNLRWATNEENCNNPITKQRNLENNWMRGRFGKEHHRAKPVVQMSMDGSFIRKWDCARDVFKDGGVSFEHICSVCRGKRKSAGGYR